MHETWCFEVSAGRDRVARKERACSKKGRRQHAREPAKSRFGRPRKQRTHGSNRRRKQRERRRETARPPPLREAHNVPLSVSGRACEVEDQPKGTRARPKGSTDRSHRHACVLLREKKWRASLSLVPAKKRMQTLGKATLRPVARISGEMVSASPRLLPRLHFKVDHFLGRATGAICCCSARLNLSDQIFAKLPLHSPSFGRCRSVTFRSIAFESVIIPGVLPVVFA